MRQVVIMIICVVIIIAGGIGEIKYLNKTAIYFNSDIEYIKNAIANNNFEAAANQADITYNSWQNIKNVWGIFINHEEIDDISEAIIELKENLKANEEKESILAIEKLKNDIEHTVKRQELRIDNIL